MKYIFYIIAFFVLTKTYGQSTEYKFLYQGTSPTCNPFKDEADKLDQNSKWKVSHGTPNLEDVSNNAFYSIGELAAVNLSNGGEKSEGLYIAYEFLTTHSYTFTFSLKHGSGGDVGIAVSAANSMIEKSNTTCSLENIPFVSEKKDIYYSAEVRSGVGNSFLGQDIYNWKPDKKYSFLWIYSKAIGSMQGSFYINSVLITDNGGEITPPVTPPNTEPPSICCTQCILAGQTPALLYHIPGTGPYNSIDETYEWRFCTPGYNHYHYPLNNSNSTLNPGPRDHSARYERSTHYTTLDDNTYYYDWSSNYVTILVSTLKPIITLTSSNYTSDNITQAFDINISGDITTLTTVVGNVIAANKIVVLPPSKLLPNLNLKINRSIFNCNGVNPEFECRYVNGREESADDSQLPQNTLTNDTYLNAHPNPTNGSTTIKYKVAKKGPVKLYITDNMGRPTTNLVDNQNVEPGEYKTTFNSNGLSSGIYFYTLITNGHREVKRLSVIKH